MLGHHYQRDEVIEFADVTGDSFKLAREAAARPEAEFILFCGVHFMAESADILTSDHQQVILPDLAAGCSMADMAAIDQVEDAWDVLVDAGVAESTVPVTYMNSAASIKAFTGRHGGTICTSSNAHVALRWAFDKVGGLDGTGKVLFMPDQHLGRNTAVQQLGLSLDDCVVFDPRKPGGGLTTEQLRDARMILWRGHCSVHGRFSVRNVTDIRAAVPDVTVIVHPECQHEVVLAADLVGSTEYIVKALDAAAPGSSWAVGTELNLVRRLAAAHPDKNIHYLDSTVCFCSTMNRIDLPHLVWAMESLVGGPRRSTGSSWTPTTPTGPGSRSTRCSPCRGTDRCRPDTICASASSCSTTPRSSTSSGPYEVLAYWARHSELRPEVVTFSLDGSGIRCAKGLRLVPDLSADDVGPLHVLVYPGGFGTRALLRDPAHLEWVRGMRAHDAADDQRLHGRARVRGRRACCPGARRPRTGRPSTSSP